MSMMQSVPRSLLSQRRPATITIKRMFDDKTRSRFEIRKRLIEAKKNEDMPEECFQSLRRSEFRCSEPRIKLIHDQCLEPCDLEPLPMDVENYTPSDKEERKYQRTWCECYSLPMKYVKAKKCYPKRPRRELRRVAKPYKCVEALNTKGAGRKKPPELVQIKCTKTGKMICCKIPAPGCKPGREDPACLQSLAPTCCKKKRTKYPSFSECQPVGLLDPIPPCECEKMANLCDVWAYWRRFHDK